VPVDLDPFELREALAATGRPGVLAVVEIESALEVVDLVIGECSAPTDSRE
jgi:hypothetical protein